MITVIIRNARPIEEKEQQVPEKPEKMIVNNIEELLVRLNSPVPNREDQEQIVPDNRKK